MIRDTAEQDQTIKPRKGRRRLAWLVVAIVAIALLVIGARPVSRLLSASTSVSAARLVFATVERGPFTRDIAAEGRVVAVIRPTLYARSPGIVTLDVHAGDKVDKGEVLASIDSPELLNQLAQQRSALEGMQVDYKLAEVTAHTRRAELHNALESARIDAVSAKRDFERYQVAFAKGAFSQAQVDHARDLYSKAKVALEQAQQSLALGKDSLNFGVKAKKLAAERQALLVKNLGRQVDNLKVRSPVAGQVGQVFVAPKATVADNAKLMSVIDLSALQVEVQVPQSFARDLGIGMTAEIRGNGQSWQGAISAISPEVVNGQVATRVRFVDSKPEHLRQNQRLSVRILLDHRDSAITVARGSFVDQSGGHFAYLVNDGIAVKTPIQTGATSIDKVEILKGLKPGDKIVISGSDNFQGADRVVISH